MKSISIIAAVVAVTVVLLSGQNANRDNLAYRSQLLEVKSVGGQYAVHRFNGRGDFEGEGATLRFKQEGAGRLRSHVAIADNLSMTSLFYGPTWLFPDSSDAPRQRYENPTFMGTPLFVPNCVPELGSNEYLHWSDVRDEMWVDMVASLPEAKAWVVGGDTTIGFSKCPADKLTLDEHVEFFADSLERISSAIREANPDAVVVADFLGDSTLSYGGAAIQPRELQARLLRRLAGRPFDVLISDMVPTLLEDRDDGSSSPFLDLGDQASGAITASAAEPSVGGWHLGANLVSDDFGTQTSNLTGTADWKDFRTDTDLGTLPLISVASSKATLQLIDPADPDGFTFAGAISTGNTDFVPDQFATSSVSGSTSTNDPISGLEWGLWTVVSDFLTVVTPIPSGPHPQHILARSRSPLVP